jgi:hypothetical protein
MTNKQYSYTTQNFLCRNCSNNAPFLIYDSCSHTDVVRDDEIGLTWEHGTIYTILGCPNCSQVSIASSSWDDGMEEESELSYRILYPKEDELPIGLPPQIKSGYMAAIKVKGIDANAFAVLMRRLLELVCEDRSAQGTDLFNKLSDLADKDEIPNKLVDVAHGVRSIGNIGAHAVLGEVTEKEVPILLALINAILEYVYSAPRLAQIAKDKLDNLKSSNKN